MNDLEEVRIGGFFAGTCVCLRVLFRIDKSYVVLRADVVDLSALFDLRSCIRRL
jgi:hypothetical protein